MPLQQGKRKLITTERINGLLIISGIYVLLPFLYITRYDYPSADDYGFAFWFSQHGLLHMIKQQYFGWGGRYLLPVLYRFNPTVTHSLAGYRLCSAGVILLFTAVVVVTMRSLFKDHLSRRQTLGLSALFIGLYFAKTPSTAEAFYWYSSYTIYQLPNICFLLLLAALVRIHRQTTPAPALLAWSALLCILIIGCNEVSLIMTCLFIGYLALTRYIKDRKLTKALAILCSICFLFAILEIAAPGNFARMSMVRRNFGSILWTFTGSFATTAIYGSGWIGPLLAASVLYIPLFGLPLARKMAAGQPGAQTSAAAPAAPPGAAQRATATQQSTAAPESAVARESAAARESTTARQPFALSVRGFAWPFAGSLVFLLLFVMWTTNGSDMERVLDVVYFFVIAGYFFLLQLLLNKYLLRLEFIDRYRTGIAVLGLGLFAATLLDLNNNVSTAYIDLLSGKARAYDEALADRDARASACKTDTCRVPALTDAPATLFFTDIRPLSDRSGLWINLHYTTYWHTGFVIPDGPPPVPASNLETLRNLGKSMRKHIEKK